MANWRKDWYAIMGPIWIWVIFIIVVPAIVMYAVMNADALPELVKVAVQSVCFALTVLLAPLAGLPDIAPRFVAKKEVDWRNRNAEMLFENEVVWEAILFLPPVLDRIRSSTGKKWKCEDRRTAAVETTKNSLAPKGSNSIKLGTARVQRSRIYAC
jgi:hypothetical protein